jgi:hypothetical protein
MNSDLAALSFTGTSVGGGSLIVATNDGAGGSDSHTIGISVTAPPLHTLNVGPNATYHTLSAALSQAHDGDVIAVQAGTYVMDRVTVTHAVTIEGVGGMAHFLPSTALANGVGLITTDANVTLQNVEISGVTSKQHNAFAVISAAGNLNLSNVSLHDNTSALWAHGAGSTVQVLNSDIGHNGGGPNAALNIGAISVFNLDSSKVHDSVGVTQVSSTAQTTYIGNDQILDGTGSPIYALDLPTAGTVIVANTSFARGAGAVNSSLIHLGGGTANPSGYLTVHDSTLVSAVSGTHVLFNQAPYISVGFQHDGIGANLIQVGQGIMADSSDYVIS